MYGPFKGIHYESRGLPHIYTEELLKPYAEYFEPQHHIGRYICMLLPISSVHTD